MDVVVVVLVSDDRSLFDEPFGDEVVETSKPFTADMLGCSASIALLSGRICFVRSTSMNDGHLDSCARNGRLGSVAAVVFFGAELPKQFPPPKLPVRVVA